MDKKNKKIENGLIVVLDYKIIMAHLFKNKYRIPSSRLPGWDYTGEGIYFITICTHMRVHWFGRISYGQMQLSEVGEIIEDEWIKTAQLRQNITLDEWIIMPDHIHAIIIINDDVVETTRRVDSMPNDKILPNHTLNGHGGRDGDDFIMGDINIKNGNPCKPRGETTRRVVSTATRSLKSNSIGSIIGQFKSISTKRIWNQGYYSFRWQPRFYDRIIRDERELNIKRRYVRLNPSRWHK